ncbi:hypothetical protein [Psychromonas sp. KJ10-2]|uniref:hypothetical protein n=1 Tax=Psychromonas sp. KJ10-2 TaxID=3391822 RepID=UPI0039B5BCB8
MNISKILLLAAIVAIIFPTLSSFVLADAPTGLARISYFTDFLSMQLKLTIIAFVLFYAHKTAEKHVW